MLLQKAQIKLNIKKKAVAPVITPVKKGKFYFKHVLLSIRSYF